MERDALEIQARLALRARPFPCALAVVLIWGAVAYGLFTPTPPGHGHVGRIGNVALAGPAAPCLK